MPKLIAPLTDLEVKDKAKPRKKDYRLFVGSCPGLHLLIKPDGKRYWVLKYTFAAKEKRLHLGPYTDRSLATMRKKGKDMRDLLAAGIDPAEATKMEEQAAELETARSFGAIAVAWETAMREGRNPSGKKWAAATARKVRAVLEADLLPALGARPVAEISSKEAVEVLRRIEQRSLHLAMKARQYLAAIIHEAIQQGLREDGRFLTLRGALGKLEKSSFPAFSAETLPQFFEALARYRGKPQTVLALRLLALTFVRPGELIGARWEEIDFEAARWTIPGARMKMRVAHTVPLSRQALAILGELRALAGDSAFVFPAGLQMPGWKPGEAKPMHRDTLSIAMRRMTLPAVPHGFRHLASTWLNEHGFAADVIEKQLAHGDANAIRAVYNKAQYWPERVCMMQFWADHLEAVGAPKVIALSKKEPVA